jgi:hypothetical protein
MGLEHFSCCNVTAESGYVQLFLTEKLCKDPFRCLHIQEECSGRPGGRACGAFRWGGSRWSPLFGFYLRIESLLRDFMMHFSHCAHETLRLWGDGDGTSA